MCVSRSPLIMWDQVNQPTIALELESISRANFPQDARIFDRHLYRRLREGAGCSQMAKGEKLTRFCELNGRRQETKFQEPARQSKRGRHTVFTSRDGNMLTGNIIGMQIRRANINLEIKTAYDEPLVAAYCLRAPSGARRVMKSGEIMENSLRPSRRQTGREFSSTGPLRAGSSPAGDGIHRLRKDDSWFDAWRQAASLSARHGRAVRVA